LRGATLDQLRIAQQAVGEAAISSEKVAEKSRCLLFFYAPAREPFLMSWMKPMSC